MTLAIVTVGEGFAALSQDTVVSRIPEGEHARASVGEDFDKIAEDGLIGSGEPPSFVSLGHAVKIHVLPNLNALLGGTGDWLFFCSWAAEVRRATGDLAELNETAPRRLRDLRDMLGLEMPTTVVCVGYSHRLGRALGFACGSDDDFMPKPIEGAHAVSPVFDTGAPDYADEIAARWAPALRGEDVEGFHVAVARNIWRTYQAGRYRPGIGIGGELHTATVDAGGIRIKRTNPFPDDLGRAEAP